MSRRFKAYGLTISSHYDLGVGSAGPRDESPYDLHVDVQFGEFSSQSTTTELRLIGDQTMRFYVPHHHDFYFSKTDRRLEVRLPKNTPDSYIPVVILNQAVPFALASLGELLIHASAVSHHNGAVLFMGRRGMGKSHFAARAIQDGYTILSDDFTRVICEDTIKVVPSFPEIRLYQKDSHRFNLPSQFAGHAGLKSRLSPGQFFLEIPASLRAIFHVRRSEDEPVQSVAIPPENRFHALMDNCLFYPTFTNAETQKRIDLLKSICESELLRFEDWNLPGVYAESLNEIASWRSL